MLKAAPYYIDQVNGNDLNDGLSPQKAWKTLQSVYNKEFAPGTHLLFKAGCKWVGQLRPRGSGTATAPIIIDRYGEGPMPHIAGEGISDHGPYAGFYEKPGEGSQNATVYLYNQEYIEINNLRITNYEPGSEMKEFIRRGILVQGDEAKDNYLNHIYIRNCHIHDISGNFKFGLEMHTAGGIIFMIVGNEKPVAFKDVRIENNCIYNVDRMGIDFKSTWRNRGAWYPVSNPEEGTGNWFPSLDVVVRNNRLDNIAGDGIIVAETSGALVEYNRCSRFNMRGIGGPAAGVWCLNTDDTLFRYNVVHDGHFVCTDSQAFDIDWNNKRTIYEYNYSYNNGGGFMLLCSPSNFNHSFNFGGIVRHNVSWNDRKNIFTIHGNVGDASVQPVQEDEKLLPEIYSNLFFINDQENNIGIIHDGIWEGYSFGYDFYNNTICVEEGASAHFTNLLALNPEAKVTAFGNVFHGDISYEGEESNPIYSETNRCTSGSNMTWQGIHCHNLALGKSIRVSDGENCLPVSYINDQKPYTVWKSKDNQVVTLDLEKTESIGVIRLCMEPVPPENICEDTTTTIKVEIQSSVDGKTYSTVEKECNYVCNTKHNYGAYALYPKHLRSRYIRLVFGVNRVAQLGELEVYGTNHAKEQQGEVKACNLYDLGDKGTVSCHEPITLSWGSEEYDVLHQVVVWDRDNTYVMQTHENSYTLDHNILTCDTSYCWKVITRPIKRFDKENVAAEGVSSEVNNFYVACTKDHTCQKNQVDTKALDENTDTNGFYDFSLSDHQVEN